MFAAEAAAGTAGKKAITRRRQHSEISEQRQVTVWHSRFTPEAADDHEDSWAEEHPVGQDPRWAGADPAGFAVAVIEDRGCTATPSSVPGWAPGTWYCGEPAQDYRDGRWLERSAHLRGFTEPEEREVYRRLTDREPEAGQ